MERTERKEDGSYWLTMTIKSIPEPTYIQWSIKENNEKAFELLNINDDEYKGTTDTFPHPVLVVKSSKFEECKFQIEVNNFIGNSAFIIQGKKKHSVYCINIRLKALSIQFILKISVLEIVQSITKTVQNVGTLKSWILSILTCF